MESASIEESYPIKPMDPPPPYNPGNLGMQPSPYPAYYPPGPNNTVQQTLICQPPSTNVVVMNGQMAPANQPYYKDYLCWSIMNLLCCCWPIGIAAVVYSCKTKKSNDIRDYTAAAINSRVAFNLNISSLVIGILFEILLAFLYYSGNL
ncbi:dispanin subfamily A member 2b-like [Leptodactylus fuscus]